MQAVIVMVFQDGEYEYGTYDYNTTAEQKFVNELAIKIRQERNCQTYVERIKE